MISPALYFAVGTAVVAVVVTELSDWSEQPAISTPADDKKTEKHSKPEVHIHTSIFSGNPYKIIYPGKWFSTHKMTGEP